MFSPTVANAGSTSLTNFVSSLGSPAYKRNTTLAAAGSRGQLHAQWGRDSLWNPTLDWDNQLPRHHERQRPDWHQFARRFRVALIHPSPILSGIPRTAWCVGDFNGDGKVDLAVTNATDNKVSILLGNGDGTFQPQATYDVGGQPGPIAVGDFNGDGKLDLAVGNLTGQTISVLIGNGDGTFQPQVTYSTSGVMPISIAVGDFNGDGKLDIVIADYPYSTVQIMIGNGDGTFQPGLASTGTAPELSPRATSMAPAGSRWSNTPDRRGRHPSGGSGRLLCFSAGPLRLGHLRSRLIMPLLLPWAISTTTASSI